MNRILRLILIIILCIAVPYPYINAAKPKRAKTSKTKKQKPKKDGNDLLKKAEYEFYLYNFDTASSLLDEYESLMSDEDDDWKPTKTFESLREHIDLGSTMMGRVEKIAVIDSLTVDSLDFFRAYRLSAPSGAIINASDIIPENFPRMHSTSVYVTENGESLLWSAPDEQGKGHIVQSSLLADGEWENPHSIGDELSLGGNANYPFLMSDGATLYYASDGEGSLGGYDIFITRNDGEEFLQPQNIGMPYNSPYNDYLLAIDDITGAGWWATDRNHIPGKITVYIFVPQEMRINYPFDTPNLQSFARLSNISATHDTTHDYSTILKSIYNLSQESAKQFHEFQFALPNGVIYTSLSDFKSPQAMRAMEQLLNTQQEQKDLLNHLLELRTKFASGDTTVSDEILQSEKTITTLNNSLRSISNMIIEAELQPQE